MQNYSLPKKLSWCLAAALATLLAPLGTASAWSSTGHRIVARVAESRLTPQARRAIRDLLGGESLADVSTLPDTWRAERPETARLHYVNIPLGGAYIAERDCEETAQGDCIVAAIERYRHVLADRSRPRAERREALVFLVHLVADAGQPLHASEDNGDRGGNLKRVCLDGDCTGFEGGSLSLHAVWDRDLIDAADIPEKKLVKKLRKAGDALTDAEVAGFVDGGVSGWLEDSNRMARDTAYGLLPAPDAAGVYHLGGSYVDAAAPVIERQLLSSALRLASVINDALGERP